MWLSGKGRTTVRTDMWLQGVGAGGECDYKGTAWEFFGTMELLHILVVVLGTWIYTCIKTLNFTRCYYYFFKKAVPEECDGILIYTCLLTTRKHLKPYFKKMYQATRLWPLMVIRESRYSGTTWRISFLASIPLSLSTEQGDLHFPIQGYQFSPQNWLSRLGKRRENVFRNDVYWSRFACILWGVHKAIILYWYDTHTFV